MEKNVLYNKIYEDLISQANDETVKEADKIVENDGVNITKVTYDDDENFEIHATIKNVDGNKNNVYIKVSEGEVENLSCVCDEYKTSYCACMHIIAAFKEFISNPEYVKIFIGNQEEAKMQIPEKEDNPENYRVFNQLVKEFYSLAEDEEENNNKKQVEGTIHIEPRIISSKFNNSLKLEIKIGEKQFYKVKSLPEFYDRFQNQEKYRYGAKLEFVHTPEMFVEEDRKLLDFILKYAEIIKYANESSTGYDYYTKRLGEDSILISNTGLDELFDALINKTVVFENQYSADEVHFIDKEPEINFNLEEVNIREYKITTDIDIYSYTIYNGRKYTYLLLGSGFYKCSKKFRNTVIKLLEIFRKNFTKEIIIPKSQLSSFFSIVEPNIKNTLKIDEEQYKKIKKYIPPELYAKLYLDYSPQNYILADIRFIYDDVTINPLENVPHPELLSRNTIKESKLIDMFVKSGFMLDQKNNRLVLANEDKIYEFLTNDINSYMKNFEVLATDNFKEKEIKSTSNISLGVRIENNLLDIDFSNLNFDPAELQEIMKKYKLKKKYHRLKNGSFINLEDNDTIKFIDSITEDIDVDYSSIKGNSLKLPMYRALYLDKILEKNSFIHVTKDDNYKKLIQDIDVKQLENNFEVPKNLNANLRQYQKVGVQWLEMLDYYGLGGILADDMGLGKTVQLLCVVCSYLEKNKKNSKPILVVCPSSLCLNWQNEIEKFTTNVSSIVIHGSLEERQKAIESIPNYNIAITSYELLKRDLEEYKKYNYGFKYIIADEAQYIKNSTTQNATSLKSLKGEIKFALTGTPIENSVAELWSIFDFIMPGYLYNYNKFKKKFEEPILKFEDKEALNRLKKLISPFILRRVKKDVLTELPEKNITIMKNEMEEEQEKIYLSYLAQTRKEVAEELSDNGFEKSKFKILMLLTRLRQICCHPSLFIENYNKGSGKLNQCLNLVVDAIQAGHKILIFSSYTSMFEIMEKELQKLNINYFKLVGNTPVSQRIEMVDEFNKNEEVKVFLISLKAGGTGLNLTSADVVIHYDPWWNISSENQATDRAYRIGQKNSVQVYKLITSNSIEEKINKMQERKEKLSKNILSTEETFINKMSKEEILDLFK